MITPLTLACGDPPSLRCGSFLTIFARPLEGIPTTGWLAALLHGDAEAPLHRSEEVRQAVRNVLRHGGYKPTGRGKPSSEYLIRAAQEGTLSSINLAVDACNAVSLHSGLPISVVDADLAREPWQVAIAPEGSRYVFNASGQEIEIWRACRASSTPMAPAATPSRTPSGRRRAAGRAGRSPWSGAAPATRPCSSAPSPGTRGSSSARIVLERDRRPLTGSTRRPTPWAP